MLRSIETLIGSILVLAALLLFLAGMVSRYYSLGLGGGWVNEVTIYLVSWALLLSAAGCVAEREHVRTDFFLRMVGAKFRHWADLLAALSGLIFCLSLAWFGWQVVEFALAWDERGPSYFQIPMAWYYAALPVSMGLCSLRYFIELISHLRAGETGRGRQA